jgi:hypothetical protein
MEKSISPQIKGWEIEGEFEGSWSYLFLDQPQKIQLLILLNLGDYNIQTSKIPFLGCSLLWNCYSKINANYMLFSLFSVFCTSVPNTIEHTWLKSSVCNCIYEWGKIIFVFKGLDSELEHCGPCKIFWKKLKTSRLDCSSDVEGDIVQNHEQKGKVKKKCKTKILLDRTNFFLSTVAFTPWKISATWSHVRAPLKVQEKWSILPVFNKNSPGAHMESELDMLGVHKKVVKYVVHSCKWKNWEKKEKNS